MKLRIAAMLACACLLLSGCMSLAQGTENLMRPPKLSVEQQKIYAALSAVVGDDIVLKYPGDGEHRSAFVMYDIDGDGEEEVIVFYASSSQSDNLHINILNKQGEDWYSIYDAVGEGPEIDSIAFRNITNTGSINIVVSYEMLSMQQKVLCVYTYKNNKLLEEFKCDYTSSLIQDFDNDGLDELFLLYNVETIIAKAMYVDTLYTFGAPTVMSEVELSTDVKQYVQIIAEPEFPAQAEAAKAQRPNAFSYIVYIDGLTSAKGNHTTELVRLRNNSISNLLVSEDNVHNINWRYVSLLTQDRNNDGVMDVPKGVPIPGWPTDSKESVVTLIEWYNYIDDQFLPINYTLVNRMFGFSLDYPAAWSAWGKKIAVKQSDDGYEWQLYEYFENNSNAQEGGKSSVLGSELLRIRVYSNNNFFDEYNTEGYVELGACEEYTYYGFIPEQGATKNDLAITYDELAELFRYENAA